jgi:arylsulfatase
MSAELELVIAAYQDLAGAQADFDGLRQQVEASSVSTRGIVLIAKDDAGKVVLYDTGDHLGRKGVGWGGVGGVLVGLFAPPMLGSVVVGAAAGGVIGKFTDHKLTAELREKIGDNLKPGSGVVLGVFPAEQRLAVEQALAQSAAKSVAALDEATLADLKAALEEGMASSRPTAPGCPSPTAPSAVRRDAPCTSRSPTGPSSPACTRRRTPRTCWSCSSTTPASGPSTPSVDRWPPRTSPASRRWA